MKQKPLTDDKSTTIPTSITAAIRTVMTFAAQATNGDLLRLHNVGRCLSEMAEEIYDGHMTTARHSARRALRWGADLNVGTKT